MGWLSQSAAKRYSWKDMSLEMRMMFIYHICMMALFISGGFLTVAQEIGAALVLIAVFTAISLRRRSEKGWNWQRPKLKKLAGAAGTLLLISLFLYSAVPGFPPSRPQFLPWYLAGFGIGLFNVLSCLNLVQAREEEFQAACVPAELSAAAVETPERAVPSGPLWKKVVRAAFQAYFFAVWILFVCFFYVEGKAFRDGSPVPTLSKHEPLTEHGRTVYISQSEKRTRDLLETASMAGIPSALLLGFAVHFVLRVKLFDYLRVPGEPSKKVANDDSKVPPS